MFFGARMYVVNSKIQQGSFVRFILLCFCLLELKNNIAFILKVVRNMHDLATHVGVIYIENPHFGNMVRLAKVQDF